MIHKSHEGELRTFQIVLDDHFAFAEGFTYQHIAQRMVCFLLVLCNHDTFACCQTIVFEYGRIGVAGTNIGDGFFVVVETAICRCRHMILSHQFFGELFA